MIFFHQQNLFRRAQSSVHDDAANSRGRWAEFLEQCHFLIVPVLIEPSFSRLPCREVLENFDVDESAWAFSHKDPLALCKVERPVQPLVEHPHSDRRKQPPLLRLRLCQLH